MKQKVTITFNESAPVLFYGRPVGPGTSVTLTADCDVVVEPVEPRAYAEVRLLDASGITSDGQRRVTWTYRNPDGYDVGQLVFVPFGWSNTSLIARIVRVGPEPEYTGPCTIKTINGKAVCA